MSSTMVISSFSIIICIIIATLLTTIVLETSAVQPVLDNSVSLQQEFEDWMAVYAKSYTNDTEKNERKKNWLGNRAFVINHNANTDSGYHNFNIELTSYAGLTNNEYRKLDLAPGFFYYFHEGVDFRQYVRQHETLVWTSATPSGGSLVTGGDPVSIVFTFEIKESLDDTNTITITADRPIWTGAVASITCTGVLAGANLNLHAGTTSTSVLEIKPNTGITFSTGLMILTCSSNLGLNGPTGEVRFDAFSDAHPDSAPLISQSGYTITGSSIAWTSASPSATSHTTGESVADMVFNFNATTALTAGDTITIVANRYIWEADPGTIYFDIPITTDLTEGDEIQIKSSNNIWSRVGYDMDINDETTACVDDATCTDVRKPCEVKVGGTDISSNVILDFKTHNTLHVKAKAGGVSGSQLELTCHNLETIGALGNINHRIVNTAPGNIQFSFQITNDLSDAHALVIVSNHDIWENSDTVTTCTNAGTATGDFVARTYVDQNNALILTASAGGIIAGTMIITCTDNIKNIDSYAVEFEGEPLEFELFSNPDRTCEAGWQIGPTGKCYKFVTTGKSQNDAKDHCVTTYGAALASIHNLEEHDFIYNTISNGDSWIGVSEVDQKSWIDGSNWNYIKWDVLSDEPDNGSGQCTAVCKSCLSNEEKNNAWRTLDCNDNLASVCMKDSNTYLHVDGITSFNLDPIITHTSKHGLETTCTGVTNSYARVLAGRALVLTATGAITPGTKEVTCTDNLANHGPVGDVSFFIVSSKDTVGLQAQTGYTIVLDTKLTWTSATTSLGYVTTDDPGSLIITFGIVTALVDTDTIKITASRSIWQNSGTATTCTVSADGGGTTPTVTAATTTTRILVVTATAGGISTGECVITCTDNLAPNGAIGAVTFDIVSTQDSTPLTGNAGYTITEDLSMTWTSASTGTSTTTGVAPGDLIFNFGITTALVATDTITITASQAIWAAGSDTSITCTLTISGVSNTNFATKATSVSVLALTASDAIAAGSATLTCSDNIAVNDAVGNVAFDIVSTQDSTPLTGQTGYNVTAGT